MKLGILRAWHETYQNYVKACEDLNVDYEVINLMDDDWIKQIKESDCDGFLLRPPYFKQYWKDMYDERVYFIKNHLNKEIYPSFDEIFIYENKNNMAYWLDIHNLPHAKTSIFYKKEDALEYLKTANYPLVFKVRTGTAGRGVEFIKNYRQGKRLVNKVFPKFHFFARGYTKWYHIKGKPKFMTVPLMDDKQYGFVMFQEKLDVKCEWRLLKIGDTYQGHQKLEGKNGKHSGSGLVGWVQPPKELLDFFYDVCELGNFTSMDVDVFETVDGKYYINELQTLFGSFDNSQMYVDGKPGRLKRIDGEWVFEEGYFNLNQSMNLRVEHFVDILKSKGIK